MLGTDGTMRHLLLPSLAVLAVLALGTAPARGQAPASAASERVACGAGTAYVCVEGGTTRLTFSSAWLARVRRNGWRMAAIAPAVKRGNVLTMPIVRTGKLTSIRRSRVGGYSSRPPDGECDTTASLTTGQGALHHVGGFVLRRGAARRPFDALVLRGQTFYWRGTDRREIGRKGAQAEFGGVWHGGPRIDFMVSPTRGRTVISALRVIEVLRSGPVLGVMGSADSRWRVHPHCEVAAAE